MRKIADQVDVSGDDYKMEQRHFIWTMYRNINIWFEKLKNILFEKGFVHEKIDEYRVVFGEIVSFESKSNKILNLDKSEVSIDGTSKISGGRPLTNIFPQIVPCVNEQHLLIRVDIAQHSLDIVHFQDGQYQFIYK